MKAFEEFSGKLTAKSFQQLIQPKTGRYRKEVLYGPRFGVDTAVIDLGNNLGLAVSSDPLSLIPSIGMKASAWLSVHLMANDMATTGFAPMYAQMVLNLPPDLSVEAFEEYWYYIHQYCEELGVAITGGHTGQIEGQNSTVSGGGTMFLTAPLDKIISSKGASPGDLIILTKEAAMTSSSILAMSFPKTVINKLGKEVYDQARDNFYRTSSLPEALLAMEVLEPNRELKAMHDVTEGGILGAILEMAQASGCGVRIDNEALPIGEAQQRIMALFGIDPRFCVGAGSMVMAVQKGKEEALLKHLQASHIQAAVVGEFTSKDEGHIIIEKGEEHPLSFDGRDPYWEAFFSAYKANWT
jgi:hydrogenase expression/formation protein HypE